MTRPVRPTRRLLTIDEYQNLPPDDRYLDELVRGRVVREPRPAGRHGWLMTRISSRLYAFVDQGGLGFTLTETGFILAEFPRTVRGPDISFVARERMPDGPSDRLTTVVPDLAIEVVSPSNRVADLQAKVMDYLDAGVRLVWVVDPRSRTVTVYRSRSEIRVWRAGEQLDGGELLPGFVLPLDDLFAA